MTDNAVGDMERNRFVDQPIRHALDAVADPSHFSGGGVVAAVTLAGAAAAAELVLALATRRKSLADQRETTEAILRGIEETRARLDSAPDVDISAFEHLMEAQRAAKAAQSSSQRQQAESQLLAATNDAAESPLRLAETGLDLLQLIQQGLPFATRFTVSDLGAAAALTMGAIEAALLTVETNARLMDEAPGRQLRERAERTRGQAAVLTADIVAATRLRLAGG